MSNFPYEAVYEHFARRLMTLGLPTDGDMPPSLIIARVADGKVIDMDVHDLRKHLATNGGKDHIGAVLRKVVSVLPPDACLLLISEAYERYVRADAHEGIEEMRKRARVHRKLSQDPSAVEIVSIQILRPDGNRLGRLPIMPGRRLAYRPLLPEADYTEGRMVPEQSNAGRDKP